MKNVLKAAGLAVLVVLSLLAIPQTHALGRSVAATGWLALDSLRAAIHNLTGPPGCETSTTNASW